MIVVEVAVAAPVLKTYSYELPLFIKEQLKVSLSTLVGRRVFVPFGSRKITGYILGYRDEEDSERKLKEIYDLLDETPLFHKEIIPLFKWVANYYHYPLGKVIQTALPGGLTIQAKKALCLTGKKSDGYLLELSNKYPDKIWLKKLVEDGKLSHTLSKKVMSLPADRQILASLIDGAMVSVISSRTRELVKKKTETCYRFSEEGLQLTNDSEPTKSGKKRGQITQLDGSTLSGGETKAIRYALQISQDLNDQLIPRKELLALYPYSRNVLPGLIEKGLLVKVDKRIFRTPFGDLLPHIKPPENLTDEQRSAVGRVEKSISQKEYKTILLHGITGSGKTEVYLRASECTLKKGKNVLVLVPEIALATQIEAHFVSRFDNKVALLHSGLTAGERYDEWGLAYAGERRIVIGARSAVFAPLKDVGLIIVDEEHDSSFKQEEQLRYNSRDIAILRGKMCQAVTILGSATPAITSYYHACSEKFELIEMKNRVGTSQLPKISVIDLKNKTGQDGKSLFRQDFVQALRETYEQGNQSILLMNRRGFSASVICRECGSMAECRHCNVTLNMHKGRNQLVCHYCGFQLPINRPCDTCGSENLLPVGFGTERVEEEVLKIIPEARIARLDSDVAADRKRFMSILQSVRDREIDILVGTQMIAKGLHFPEVTLVGVVWADGGLAFPDYRAAEKTYQLIAQVTGRAGRGEKPGRVIIQTMQPQHYAISLAAEHDYQRLVNRELEIRREAGFPPFVRLVSVRIEAEKEKKARDYSMEVAAEARLWCKSTDNPCPLQILGPAPAPIERIRDIYRWQILLKGDNITQLHNLVRFIATKFKKSGKEKLIIDVDPENML